MRTNVEIDEVKMAKVMKILGTKTKRETVDVLLREKVERAEQIERQKGLKELQGIGWSGNLSEMRRD